MRSLLAWAAAAVLAVVLVAGSVELDAARGGPRSLVAGAAARRRGSYGTEQAQEKKQHEEEGGGKQGGEAASDSELLDKLLHESEAVALIEHEQAKHERRLNELQQRLERELISVQQHFESVMSKLKATETQLETNLRNVERAISSKVEESKKSVKASNEAWRLPFFLLVVLVLGVAGFFGGLYRKATKNIRML